MRSFSDMVCGSQTRLGASPALDSTLLTGTAFCNGPGLVAASVAPLGSDLFALQRLYVTPVDEELIELLGVVTIRCRDTVEETEALLTLMSEEVFKQWQSDIPIWEHKIYRAHPALNEVDGVIPVFRRWYRQFYREAL